MGERKETSPAAKGCACLSILLGMFVLCGIIAVCRTPTATPAARAARTPAPVANPPTQQQPVEVATSEKGDGGVEFVPTKIEGITKGDAEKKVEAVLGPSSVTGSTADYGLFKALYPNCSYAFYPVSSKLVIYRGDGSLLDASHWTNFDFVQLKRWESGITNTAVPTGRQAIVTREGEVIPRGPSGNLRGN